MVLDGHMFFAHEISPVLALAHAITINNYSETDDTAWLSANVAIAGTKVRINKMVDDEEYSEPTLIRKGDALWSEIDSVLAPVASDPQVFSAVSRLPRDIAPLAAGASWLRPAAAVGVLAAIAGLGYWWARKA